MINLLTQYYISQHRENDKCLISSLPLPLAVIHECNLQCIYTTNEAIAHFKLDSESQISKEYLYLYLKNFNYDELGSTSSIAKAINSKIVKKIPILVPESNKLNEFKELFENIFNEIKSNQLEINNLTKLRDTLLPKLMSGEIDVSEINCDLE